PSTHVPAAAATPISASLAQVPARIHAATPRADLVTASRTTGTRPLYYFRKLLGPVRDSRRRRWLLPVAPRPAVCHQHALLTGLDPVTAAVCYVIQRVEDQDGCSLPRPGAAKDSRAIYKSPATRHTPTVTWPPAVLPLSDLCPTGSPEEILRFTLLDRDGPTVPNAAPAAATVVDSCEASLGSLLTPPTFAVSGAQITASVAVVLSAAVNGANPTDPGCLHFLPMLAERRHAEGLGLAQRQPQEHADAAAAAAASQKKLQRLNACQLAILGVTTALQDLTVNYHVGYFAHANDSESLLRACGDMVMFPNLEFGSRTQTAADAAATAAGRDPAPPRLRLHVLVVLTAGCRGRSRESVAAAAAAVAAGLPILVIVVDLADYSNPAMYTATSAARGGTTANSQDPQSSSNPQASPSLFPVPAAILSPRSTSLLSASPASTAAASGITPATTSSSPSPPAGGSPQLVTASAVISYDDDDFPDDDGGVAGAVVIGRDG
ncbi:hypothetical protein HK405_013260, partial [Cladochytrium tenue]